MEGVMNAISYLLSARPQGLTQTMPNRVKSPIPQSQIVPHKSGPRGLEADFMSYKQGVSDLNTKINTGVSNYKQGVQNLNKKINTGISNAGNNASKWMNLSKGKQPLISKPKVAQSPIKQQVVSQATPTPTQVPVKQQIAVGPAVLGATSTPTFKFQAEIDKVGKELGLTGNDFHLLRAGENRAENPEAIYINNNGTVDVGLFQVNAPANDLEEIERLKNPEYNARRAGEIWKQRLKTLEDPVLALASYNLGAGGAVLRPLDALKRAQWVYYNAGVPMPQTEFTKDPLGYVRQRMAHYKSLGLFI